MANTLPPLAQLPLLARCWRWQWGSSQRSSG